MDWRAAAGQPPTFGFSRLLELACVSEDRAVGWRRRGAWPVRRNGRKHVRYSLWDAIRVRIIREVSDAGLPITGPSGLLLTSTLTSIANFAASSGPGDLSTVAEQVKLFRDDSGEWCVDISGNYPLEDERLGTFVFLIRLRKIVEEVGERFSQETRPSPAAT